MTQQQEQQKQHWIDSLKSVRGGESWIQLIQLSQRIQSKIKQLEPQINSPTDTLVDHSQGLNKNNNKLVVVITKQQQQQQQQQLLLPSVDSAVDVYTFNNKPPYTNKLNHIPILYTKKKYIGLKGVLLKRRYQINDIIVTKSKDLSYYFVQLLSSFDKITGEKKAVLKIYTTFNTTHSHLFIIPYCSFTFYHHSQKKIKQTIPIPTISNTELHSALYIWLNYYHYQLPSIQHITHILRQDLTVYIVYQCI